LIFTCSSQMNIQPESNKYVSSEKISNCNIQPQRLDFQENNSNLLLSSPFSDENANNSNQQKNLKTDKTLKAKKDQISTFTATKQKTPLTQVQSKNCEFTFFYTFWKKSIFSLSVLFHRCS
jgi:hypothetical protein